MRERLAAALFHATFLGDEDQEEEQAEGGDITSAWMRDWQQQQLGDEAGSDGEAGSG